MMFPLKPRNLRPTATHQDALTLSADGQKTKASELPSSVQSAIPGQSTSSGSAIVFKGTQIPSADRHKTQASELASAVQSTIPGQSTSSGPAIARKGAPTTSADGHKTRACGLEGDIDMQTMAKVRGQLDPKGWRAQCIDIAWNRGLAVGFYLLPENDQERLNAARDFLMYPPTDIIILMHRLAKINKTLQSYGAVPITAQNACAYSKFLSEGKILVLDADGEERTQIIKDLTLFTKIAYHNLLENSWARTQHKHGCSIADCTEQLNCWVNSVHTAAKNYTDSEFRALVSISTESIVDNDHDPALVEELVRTIFEDSRGYQYRRFIKDVANEFCETTKIANNATRMEAIQRLTIKLKIRAQNIAKLLHKKEDKDRIYDQLLNDLNDIPVFKGAFMEAQKSLVTEVKNHRCLLWVVKQELEAVNGYIDSISALARSASSASNSHTGEKALLPVFSALLFPETARFALSMSGYANNNSTVMEGMYADISKNFIRLYQNIEYMLDQFLLYNSHQTRVVSKKKSKLAADELSLLNQLVCKKYRNQKRGLCYVNIQALEESHPHPTEDDQISNEEFKELFLPMIEKLAGKNDSEAFPTLLRLLTHTIQRHKAERFRLALPDDLLNDDLFTFAHCDKQKVKAFAHCDKQKVKALPPDPGGYYESISISQFANNEEGQRNIDNLRALLRTMRNKQTAKKQQ